MNLMEKYLGRMAINKGRDASQNKPLSSYETGVSIDIIEKKPVSTSQEAGFFLMGRIDEVDKDREVENGDLYCSWLKKEVSECHKPRSCYYRDEMNTPVECQHLKSFVRQRNEELGLNG